MTDQIPTGALAFLSTPYSLRPDLNRAHVEACTIAGKLMRAGIHIFSPIAHGHVAGIFGVIDPFDHEFWLAQNEPMLQRCDILIVANMEGFEVSKGIEHEVNTFVRLGKPIFDLDITSLTMTKRKPEKPHRDRYEDMHPDDHRRWANEYLQPDQPIPANSPESSQGQERPVDFLQGGELAGDQPRG